MQGSHPHNILYASHAVELTNIFIVIWLLCNKAEKKGHNEWRTLSQSIVTVYSGHNITACTFINPTPQFNNVQHLEIGKLLPSLVKCRLTELG